MKISVKSTAFPTGEVKEHNYGLNIHEIKRPLTDLGFNLRVKNVQRELYKLYKQK